MSETTISPNCLPQLTIEIKFYLNQTAQNIIEVGKRLIQAKELVERGEWQNWLEANFSLTTRSARRFMAVAERFGKTEIDFRFTEDLSPTQMIAMLALPAGDEEKFIAEKAAEGTPVENMTIKNLREEIRQYKFAKEKRHQCRICIFYCALLGTVRRFVVERPKPYYTQILALTILLGICNFVRTP